MMNAVKEPKRASWRQADAKTPWRARDCSVVTCKGHLVATATSPEAARLMAGAPRFKASLSILFEHHELCGATDVAQRVYSFWEDTLDMLAEADPDRYGPEARAKAAAERAEREREQRAREAEAERMYPPEPPVRTRDQVSRELAACQDVLAWAQHRCAELDAELAAWPAEA